MSPGQAGSSEVQCTRQRGATCCLMVRYGHPLCCWQSDTKYFPYSCCLCSLQSRILYQQLPSLFLTAGIYATMFYIKSSPDPSSSREIITLLPPTHRQLHRSYESCASLSPGLLLLLIELSLWFLQITSWGSKSRFPRFIGGLRTSTELTHTPGRGRSGALPGYGKY